MDRGSGDLNSVIQCRFVDTKSVETLSAKGRDQGRMNIDDPFRITLYKVLTENGHVTGKNDQGDLVFIHDADELFSFRE